MVLDKEDMTWRERAKGKNRVAAVQCRGQIKNSGMVYIVRRTSKREKKTKFPRTYHPRVTTTNEARDMVVVGTGRSEGSE